MLNEFKVRPFINKTNKQISIVVPKKRLNLKKKIPRLFKVKLEPIW